MSRLPVKRLNVYHNKQSPFFFSFLFFFFFCGITALQMVWLVTFLYVFNTFRLRFSTF